MPLLVSAVVTPVLGKLGDLYGHRRVFLVGFASAAVATAATSTAWNALTLISWRTLTQMMGAATGPTSMALINSVYPPERRVRAMGWWAMVAAGSPAIGLALGGPLIESVGWRALFLIQAVLMAIAVLVAAAVLQETQRRRVVRFDVAGSVTLMVGTACLMFVLSQTPEWGITHPWVLACALVSPAALVAFVHAERRAVDPLLPLGLFRGGDFVPAGCGALFAGASYMGAYFLAPILLIELFGYSKSLTSWMLLVRPVVFSASSPMGGAVGVRWGEKRTAVVGSVVMTVGIAAIALGALAQSVSSVLAGFVLQGMGHGLLRPPLSAALANSVGRDSLGIAGAAERMAFQVGASFGVTALTVAYAGSDTPERFALAFGVGAVLSTGVLVASLALSARRGGELGDR